MAECGNMPDWHPYTQPQGSRPSAAPTGAQNASTGHMFMSSMSPPALDGMNLSTESRHQSTKHQNDPSAFVPRNYQQGAPIAPPNCPTSSSLTSGVHMTSLGGCVSHYSATSTRNAMMESLSSSMDPRMGPAAGITEEVAHRNSQMPFPGPTNHPNAPSINVNAGNAIHASTMAAQNSPVGSMSPGRQGPGYGACKGPCCNTDANIPYQHWEKYGHYHGAPNANAYRENIRQPAYPMDNRRFMPDINLRKECLDGKDIEGPAAPFPVDHRRNYPDYKYRKDNVLPRNYPNNGNNLMQNYPMQNYNFPNDYQKCPYSVKDYLRRGNTGGSINSKNSNIFKYQEQQNVIAQQKYQHSKQMQYQNGSVMPSGIPNSTATSSMPSPLQNSYYNPATMPRDLARDYSRDYQQEQSVVVTNRMPQPPNSHVHGSFQKYHQVYHQKMAMQRYSMENHLRAFSRIPGYQSHPKYQECVMRYRELLRLQQTVDYQNALQEAPKIPSPANPAAVAPINLQFDQNGILINSNFIPPGYSGIHGGINPIASTESADPSINSRINAGANLEAGNQFVDHTEPSMNLTRDLDNHLHRNGVPTMHENPERYFMAGEKPTNTERYEKERGTANESENSVNVDEANKRTDLRAGNSSATANETTNSENIAYKNSKDFADKPELDVRQFLANWDESEDEDTAATNMPDVGLSDANARQFEEPSFSTENVENTTQQPNNPSDNTIRNENKEDSSVLATAEGQSTENVVETTAATTEEVENNTESQREVLPKEIQCIRTDDGVDDIPTIHIVDSLEGGSEMEKIHTVFGSLASTVLNPISIGENTGNTVGEGETIVLFEQGDGVCAKALEFSVSSEGKTSEVVEGVIASIIDSSTVEAVTIVDSAEKSAYKSSESVDNAANDQLVEPTTSIIASSSSSEATYTTTNTVASSSCSSKSNSDDSTNLPKQNSFTSDESHNPDDISLPDLQTSECTPISTTLNTPIHSDSEESSEHVSDLTISTNPIEIIQNSPIISFTHSPIKIEPYEQLDDARMDRTQRQREHDSLDFDFDREVACRENEKYNETTEASEASVVDDLERRDRNSTDSMLLEDIREPSNNYNEKNCVVNDRENEFYPTADPLVGMNHISESDDQTEGGEAQTCKNSNDQPPSAEKNDSRGETSVDGILTSDQLDNDKCPTILEREDDFNRSEDLDKLCDISLDGSCMIPLIPEEEDCDEPRMPVPPMEGNCLTKILNDTMPITDLDVFESSDQEKIDKTDDDMWTEVRFMDKNLEGNSADKTKNESKKLRKADKSTKIRQEKTSPTKSKHHSDKIDDTSQEMIAKSNINAEIEAQPRISSPERESEATESEADKADKTTANSSLEVHKLVEKRQKEECREAPKKSKDSCRRRHSRDGKQSEECSRDLENERTLENDAKNTTTKGFLTKHRDSNVEIQVANLNLKIHENEVIRSDAIVSKSKNQESSGDSVDAIEIKINLSRSDLLRSRTKKFLDEDRRAAQELLEIPDTSSQTRENAVCPSGNKCCRRRRRSMHDGFENTKRTRKNEDERAQHYTAKRIKNRSRHKIRKSMDDALLMNQDRSRNENLLEERNFHLEMAKTFNLPWPREDVPETGDSCSSLTTKDEEMKRDNKSTTTKSGNDSRADKHTKDSRTIPSPSYNSSMENSSTLDFDNFDVAPHNSSDTDPEPGTSINDFKYGKARARLEDRDRYRNPTNYSSTNFDELASLDAFEINLNTVPIYTTKDGRINYSPNRNYTYRALIMEARQREGYPPLRKLHYPRHLAKNHYREDNNQRKTYKKRHDDERTEKKRRSVDYHLGKSKRPTSTRHHVEETETRGGIRIKKHDNKRNDTRIPSEFEYCSNEESRSFCGDVSLSKTRSSDSISASFKPESLKNLPEVESASHRTEILRTDDVSEAPKHSSTNYNGPSAIKNVIDSIASPKHFSNHELDDPIVTSIFQGQELEISSRKTAEDCEERLHSERLNCRRNSRFFQDSELSLKTPMASPLINLEKRPIGWDIEPDCQTVLSDSGLESSTTYVEASKESTRKIQRWKNSFVKKTEINRPIYTNREDYEAIDLSDHKIEEKTVRYLNNDEPKSLRINQDEKVEILVASTTHKTAENENTVKEIPKETSSIIVDEKMEKTEKKIDDDKPTNAPAPRKPLVTSDIILEPNRMSEIVKSLDLAITSRHSGVFKEINKIEWEPKSLVKKDRPASIFRRDKEVDNLMCKVSEALTRRASSDDVDSRESRNLFFEFPRIPEVEVPKYPEEQETCEPPVLLEETEKKIVEDTENQKTEISTNVAVERSATPETFETPCKDFWMDTSTSFSSCLKLRVPEPISVIPSESEASHLEDTSTRFASESMDFKEINETSNFQGNFTFTSQENVNSSAIDDITGRDSFFSNITENAMTASDDCSRKSSELPEEPGEKKSPKRKDSTEKAPILSFSGQIHDSRHDDSPSKSPPCLINENSIPNLVIEKNETPKLSPKHPLEISRESLEESDKKPPAFDQDISSHPKIPKMIIRNLKSRPGTPTTVENEAETGNSTKEEQLFEIKLGNREENREECKVPKMKIKLEEKQLPRMMIMDNPNSLEISPEVMKNYSKVKIRKLRRSSTSRSPIRAEKVPLVGKLSRQSSETDMQLDFPENMDNSNASSSYKFTLIEKSSSKAHNQSTKVEKLEEDAKQDRIPKLTIKKQEVTSSGYSSNSLRKKRRSRSPGESSSRKRKGSSRHGSNNRKEETRSQERRTNSLDNEGNTDSQSLSEKVPKVIIKRTSPSAEFKCELSKVGREAITKDSKWQPEVKLQRSWVLDCMAKDPGNGKLALKMLESSVNSKERNARKIFDWKRSVSDCDLDKPQPHSITSISNNRRRSLDEFPMNDRRISHGKDIVPRQGNYEISEYLAKSKKLPSSSIRVENEPETTSARKSESETAKSSSSTMKTPVKDDETSRNKLNINDNSTTISTSKKLEKNTGNYEEIESSVIKLDSSDESQTTIEILPASPDNSQAELDSLERTSEDAGNVHCGAMGKLYSDDAIPTQFELELEIVDNSTVDSLDVPMPMPEDTSLEEDSTSTLGNLHKLERFKPYRVNTEDESVATDLGCEKFLYSDESISSSARNPADSSLDVEASAKIICCSDSLVKEVLAAKETLKRCLTKAKSISRPKLKPRPKTAAEKKQGSGFHFIGLSEFAKTSKSDVSERAVFHNDGGSPGKIQATVTLDNNTKIKIKDDKTVHNSHEKQDNKHHKLWNNERRDTEETVTSSTSSKSSKHSATTSSNSGGLKTNRKSVDNENYGENSKTKSVNSGEGAGHSEKSSKHRSSPKSTGKIDDKQQSSASNGSKIEDSPRKIKSYKIPKISRSRTRTGSEESTNQEKRKTPSPTIMPVLEPQVQLSFELAGSDRDTSRSPPVITKQEENNLLTASPKKIEENVHSDKMDSITKQDSEAVTFANIVSQLAYHEKATIRHRRYCTLCERWFPTAARHRRHLTGYQHRHTELTQRRTVHALFMLFTGKPCPRLLPASIVRTDCLPGEPTPLQIAVQDVAISLEDGAQVKPKDVSEKDE